MIKFTFKCIEVNGDLSSYDEILSANLYGSLTFTMHCHWPIDHHNASQSTTVQLGKEVDNTGNFKVELLRGYMPRNYFIGYPGN